MNYQEIQMQWDFLLRNKVLRLLGHALSDLDLSHIRIERFPCLTYVVRKPTENLTDLLREWIRQHLC
jgi:hypothetical protein